MKLAGNATLRDLVYAFDQNRDRAIDEIYSNYRIDFIEFGKKWTSNREILEEGFQEAVITLYEKLMVREVRAEEGVAVKTFLFGIGKNKLWNLTGKAKSRRNLIDANVDEKTYVKESEVEDDRKATLEMAFSQLGEKCQKVLLLFYYHRYSIEAIMHTMKYKNMNTVKAHKSRCLGQMREVMTKEL